MPDQANNQAKILFVDDEESNLIFFKSRFAITYQVFVTRCAEEALRLFETHDIKVIISDQNMPGMSGVELLERIQQQAPDSIRMLMTGYDDIDAVIEAINKGRISYYFKKPLDPAEISAVIANAFLEIERRESMDELVTASEERFRSTLEQAAIGIAHTTPNGDFLRFNQRFLEILDLDSQKLAHLNLLCLVQPDGVQEGDTPLLARLLEANAAPLKREMQTKTANGVTKWIDITISLITKKNGAPDYLIVFVEDISRRKQAEHILANYQRSLEETVRARTVELRREIAERRQVEEQLNDLFNLTTEGLLFIDEDHTIRKANTTFLKLWGVTSEEVVGQKCHDFFRHTTCRMHARGEENCQMHVAAAGNRLTELELELPLPGGITLTIIESGGPVFDADNTFRGLLMSYRDITDRKKMEKELRQLSEVIEQSPVSVVITDTEGIIEYVNPNFTKVTGYSAEEAIGKNPRLLSSGYQSKEFYRQLWTTIKSNQVWHGELANKKKNGEVFWEKATISAVCNANGDVTNFVAVKKDITDRKRTDQALRDQLQLLEDNRLAMLSMMEDLEEAKQTAEEAAKAKSDFLANMSHEIRTPMNAIMGLTHLALQTELTSKQENYLIKINNASYSLLRIINDILDFSKIEAGKLTLEHIPFTLKEVIDNIVDIIDINAQRKGLELVLNIAPGTPDDLVGDPLRLSQVLINLANNAVKFTEQGEVVLAVSCLATKKKQVVLRFSVTDTGVGINEEKLDSLFQAFNQVDSSITRRYGGSGLGLTICKRLVDLMHGDIEVESRLGRGSTFSFTARLERGARKKATQLLVPKDLRGKRVLVVDDNPTVSRILEATLKSLFFRVTVAASGAAALVELEQGVDDDDPFRLVLVDWQMPGMDGITTCRQILNNSKIKETPALVMVTAYGREEVLHRIEQIPIDAYLFKPVSASTLYDTIMSVFGRDAKCRTGRRRKTFTDEQLTQVAGARVLVAEDNEINQQVARELLENWQIRVTMVGNGLEAVRKAKEHLYDLVYLDIQMPEMDGFAACHEIRQLEPYRRIPIVAMTAHAMVGDQAKSLAAGMDDHITKPLEPEELLANLVKWIKPGQRPRSADENHEIPFGRPDRRRAAAMEDNELPDGVPGLDTADGLQRVGGNQHLYRQLLRDFLRDNRDTLSRLATEVSETGPQAAVQLVHTLKGVAGTLGADGVQKAAQNLETNLKQGATANEITLFAELSRQLEPLLSGLETFFAAPDAKQKCARDDSTDSTPLLDASTLVARLREFMAFCAINDMHAEPLFAEFRDTLHHHSPVETERMADLLDTLDFPACHLIAKSLIQQLSSGSNRTPCPPTPGEQGREAQMTDEATPLEERG